ncbi:DOT1-domain-containing protein, partial [Coniophora puteana RWD-64-598 SS2]
SFEDFSNPDDQSDTTFEWSLDDPPTVELEYPNSNACETFMLLAPKDKDHYNPILCLEQSLHVIYECYLTPSQRDVLGTIPFECRSDPEESPPSSPPPLSPPAPFSSSAVSPDSPRSVCSTFSLDGAPARIRGAGESEPEQAYFHSLNPTGRNYLSELGRALKKGHGPQFIKAMVEINRILRALKYPPLPADPFAEGAPMEWGEGCGIPSKVSLRILEETYQRCVGPHVNKLNRSYDPFSSSVYGELMPSFTTDIIRETRLRPSSLFLDLGSGVGNVVLQAALQVGCRAYGIEKMAAPSACARNQLAQVQKRCRMWGVSMGEVELEEGDMLASARVTDLLPKADVVLVNNKVFAQSLNEALRPKFLDLKEGAIVVSLTPFVPVNARITERNVDDISAIFDVRERPYHSGSVSWGSGSGSYYIHTVDREGYAGIRQRFENFRARRSGSRHS